MPSTGRNPSAAAAAAYHGLHERLLADAHVLDAKLGRLRPQLGDFHGGELVAGERGLRDDVLPPVATPPLAVLTLALTLAGGLGGGAALLPLTTVLARGALLLLGPVGGLGLLGLLGLFGLLGVIGPLGLGGALGSIAALDTARGALRGMCLGGAGRGFRLTLSGGRGVGRGGLGGRLGVLAGPATATALLRSRGLSRGVGSGVLHESRRSALVGTGSWAAASVFLGRPRRRLGGQGSPAASAAALAAASAARAASISAFVRRLRRGFAGASAAGTSAGTCSPGAVTDADDSVSDYIYLSMRCPRVHVQRADRSQPGMMCDLIGVCRVAQGKRRASGARLLITIPPSSPAAQRGPPGVTRLRTQRSRRGSRRASREACASPRCRQSSGRGRGRATSPPG